MKFSLPLLSNNPSSCRWIPTSRRSCDVMVMTYRIMSNCIHDDVTKWKHFPRFWRFLRGPHRWIRLTKTSDAELWCFLWSAPKQMVEQTIGTLVIWDALYDVTAMCRESHVNLSYAHLSCMSSVDFRISFRARLTSSKEFASRASPGLYFGGNT